MEIVLMNDNAIIPTRASKESAGLDLYSSICILVLTRQKFYITLKITVFCRLIILVVFITFLLS